MCDKCDEISVALIRLRGDLANLRAAHKLDNKRATASAAQRFIREFAALGPGQWVDIPYTAATYSRVANWAARAKRGSGFRISCLAGDLHTRVLRPLQPGEALTQFGSPE